MGKQSGDGPKKKRDRVTTNCLGGPQGPVAWWRQKYKQGIFFTSLVCCHAGKKKKKKKKAAPASCRRESEQRLCFLPVNFDQPPDELLSTIGHVIPRAPRQRQSRLLPSLKDEPRKGSVFLHAPVRAES